MWYYLLDKGENLKELLMNSSQAQDAQNIQHQRSVPGAGIFA